MIAEISSYRPISPASGADGEFTGLSFVMELLHLPQRFYPTMPYIGFAVHSYFGSRALMRPLHKILRNVDPRQLVVDVHMLPLR
jgi:hypothetical protein